VQDTNRPWPNESESRPPDNERSCREKRSPSGGGPTFKSQSEGALVKQRTLWLPFAFLRDACLGLPYTPPIVADSS